MVTVEQVATVTGGTIQGDLSCSLTGIGSLSGAGPNDLSFFSDASQQAALENTKAGAMLLRECDAGHFDGPRIIVADPYLAYARASSLFVSPDAGDGHIDESAVIDETAVVETGATVAAGSVIGANSRIAKGARIGSHVSVGADCHIGADTVVEPNVSIYARSRIGQRCRISSGAVIGSSGFGYAPDGERWVRIEHLGGVRIGDDVDIGANTTIDRGALDDTVIGDGVKLDNQIQIAHNVQVGDHTAMAAFVGIAGSTDIGRGCRLGGRASIQGHSELADGVTVHTTSFVNGSILEPGATFSAAIPAQAAAQWRRNAAHIRRLDDLARKVRQLEKENTRKQKEQ